MLELEEAVLLAGEGPEVVGPSDLGLVDEPVVDEGLVDVGAGVAVDPGLGREGDDLLLGVDPVFGLFVCWDWELELEWKCGEAASILTDDQRPNDRTNPKVPSRQSKAISLCRGGLGDKQMNETTPHPQ